MPRYQAEGSFIIEERKGFQVTKTLSQSAETASMLSSKLMLWLSDYNSEYCHSLSFSVKEQNS